MIIYIDIAKKMIKDGINFDTILKYVKLTKEQLEYIIIKQLENR